ncbi:pentatricopeptide repeat-containing protein At4g39530-like [Selaginella moellendorffii]|uniref:pentatricopeptide repeat-containing protein At4g39530-like n=1 Tax=Selaginella moellendorffii TaxID=88036 RepID=UPI000D1C6CBE|nr:pentatricopeptide repeat-containing protein At4g39530-like [Selaginella moellendorffii]|eukprot:XP_024544493.1 pentatricopeptide repeat-containing protein At4g39530-like [Selaginella moellendorffii]
MAVRFFPNQRRISPLQDLPSTRSHEAKDKDYQVLRIYTKMRDKGEKPSISIVLAALKACSKTRNLRAGRIIHADQSKNSDEELEVFVANSLVDMYAKCGSMLEAQRVFDRMPRRDVISWTSLMSGYVQTGNGELALELFAFLQEEQGLTPNARTFVAALRACADTAAKENSMELSGKLVKPVSLEKGMFLHSRVGQKDLGSDVFVASSLVEMYSKCGSLEDSYRAFRSVEKRDVVLWNSMIMGASQGGDGELALELFGEMRKDGLVPNSKTFQSVLKACAALAGRRKCLEECKHVADLIFKSPHKSDTAVLNALVDTYVKCGSLASARKVFEKIPNRDVVSWTTLISGYAQNGEAGLALELYERMKAEKLRPNARTMIAAAKACTQLARENEKELGLEKGRAIHSEAVTGGFESDIFVANALIDMYGECGSLPEARQVFDRMPQRDIVSWNIMILKYASSSDPGHALELFDRLKQREEKQEQGLKANSRTYVAALKACAELSCGSHQREGDEGVDLQNRNRCLEKAREIQSQAEKDDFSCDAFIGSSLVDIFAKCGRPEEARQVLERMKNRDVISWSALILGYVHSGETNLALECFARMQEEDALKPDARAYVAGIKACCAGFRAKPEEQAKFVSAGTAIHSRLGDYESQTLVANALVDMYANFGRMDDAKRVFDRMKQRDLISWTALILGYAKSGKSELALELFERMQSEERLEPDARTFVAALKACSEAVSGSGEKMAEKEKIDASLRAWCLDKGAALHAQVLQGGHEDDLFVANGLLEMYVKCGSVGDALKVFNRMKQPDLAAWNLVITGYAQSRDEASFALELFSRMKEQRSLLPDARTYAAVVKACTTLAALETGREIHAESRKAGLESDELVASSLVDFYAKCGSMAESEQVFEAMSRKNLVAWNALIAGYGYHGDTGKVFSQFERMQASSSLQPDGVTLLCVLNACNHAGLVDKGKEIFEKMRSSSSSFGVAPGLGHYTCMVDLLGRKNHLREALALVEAMPIRADRVIWMTVLAAARKWKDVEVARIAFEAVVELDSEDSAAYSLMANTYAAAGMWKESHEIRRRIKTMDHHSRVPSS